MLLEPLLMLAAAAAPVPAGQPMPLHVGGRVVRQADGTLRFGWPGTYFESRFRGSGVTVVVESPTEHFRLLVDGREKAVLEKPGQASLTLDGLTDGEHVVRLEKLTESQSGGGRFIGFFPTAGDQPLAPTERRRQIEFIGDSYTVGYGNTSAVRACSKEEVHDTTDTQQAFGPRIARRFNADYRINAYSGFGIVRNYNGSSPDLSLPIIYPRLIPGEASPIESGSDDWHPQLIVINLGTNDFSTPVHKGERWPDAGALHEDYRKTYTRFLRGLMAAEPQARFLLMSSDEFDADVKQVAAAADAAGTRVSTLHFGDMEKTGCDYHPSLKDDAMLADQLSGWIEGKKDLWPETM